MGLMSRRDKQSVVRRTSQKAKAVIFIVIAVLILISIVTVFLLISHFMSAAPGLGPVDALMAGRTFEPGAVADLYGSQTTAIIEGVNQRVQAVNPTQEWKDSLLNVACQGATCVADAPKSLSGAAGEAGATAQAASEGGGVFDNLLGRFMPEGGWGALAGMLVLFGVVYLLLEEDGKKG